MDIGATQAVNKLLELLIPLRNPAAFPATKLEDMSLIDQQGLLWKLGEYIRTTHGTISYKGISAADINLTLALLINLVGAYYLPLVDIIFPNLNDTPEREKIYTEEIAGTLEKYVEILERILNIDSLKGKFMSGNNIAEVRLTEEQEKIIAQVLLSAYGSLLKHNPGAAKGLQLARLVNQFNILGMIGDVEKVKSAYAKALESKQQELAVWLKKSKEALGVDSTDEAEFFQRHNLDKMMSDSWSLQYASNIIDRLVELIEITDFAELKEERNRYLKYLKDLIISVNQTYAAKLPRYKSIYEVFLNSALATIRRYEPEFRFKKGGNRFSYVGG
ncbi:MAG: hypothetical protein JNK26_05175 [Candidatus Doudnabacteria bacterium]|nr:hypothetical protein [Candidatus Doudnabacteria bacterium]